MDSRAIYGRQAAEAAAARLRATIKPRACGICKKPVEGYARTCCDRCLLTVGRELADRNLGKIGVERL